jgi:hypothetical protein
MCSRTEEDRARRATARGGGRSSASTLGRQRPSSIQSFLHTTDRQVVSQEATPIIYSSGAVGSLPASAL